ncbi:39362_t:CDS:2, partial [Gigaspora margarita]
DQGVVILGSNFEPYAENLNNARVVFGAGVAVGKDNFEAIIEDRLTFVNKSMLIKEFIESSDFVSLIFRPRRFGKSTNLSMLNRFFKIPYSQEENVICNQLFEKLKISAEKKIMQNHFAQYPIIYISLKDKMVEKLKIHIATIYRGHRYLIDNLYSDEQKKYQKFLYEESTESQLLFALQELFIYLRQHYKKKCIVLIDEYDSPIECAYNKGYYEVANEFFKGMLLSLLKLYGVEILYGPDLYMLVDSSLYVDKFGFTSDEVELLLSLRENLQINDVQKWYGGYVSGGTLKHWKNVYRKQALHLRNPLKNLAIWTLLYYAGYLAMNSEKHLVIPNKEIRSEWHNWMINVPFFTQGQTITSMLDNLLHGNLDLFSKEFENMIVDTLLFYEVGGSISGKNAEYVYHAFCLGVFAHARDRGFIIHSNHEAGLGRYDVKIVPKPGVYETAIIIEFKVVRDKKSLYDMAQEGLFQIEEKWYRVVLEENVKKLLKIGIAFEGKKACVLGRLLYRTEEGVWNKDYERLISD